MAEITWTHQALLDLDRIAEFIAQDSEYYAELTVVRIFERVEQLPNFPESGRIVPEAEQEDIRELLLGNYRIIYHYSDSLVTILTIHHGARLLEREALEERLKRTGLV